MVQPNLWPQVSQSIWPSSGQAGAFESMRSLRGRSIPSGSKPWRRSRAVPSTWKQLRRATRWDDLASLKKWLTQFFSWPPMRRRSSRARFSRSMEGTSRNKFPTTETEFPEKRCQAVRHCSHTPSDRSRSQGAQHTYINGSRADRSLASRKNLEISSSHRGALNPAENSTQVTGEGDQDQGSERQSHVNPSRRLS